MKEWLDIDATDFRRERTQEIRRGVQVKLAVSPYEIPQGVRGFPEEGTNFFVIDFKYLVEDEPREETRHDNPHVRVEIGKHSKRIYRIKIDVVALDCDVVGLAVEAIDELPRPINRLTESYNLTKEIVLQNKARLLAT